VGYDIQVKFLSGTMIGFTNYSASSIKNYNIRFGNFIGHPREVYIGSIYYYVLPSDTTITIPYQSYSNSITIQLPTIDSDSYGIIKDWYNPPSSL
jgi:hypothetical protein